MTKQRDLKALVRERMEKTGESYMQAKKVLQEAAWAEEMDKLGDVPAMKRPPGCQCHLEEGDSPCPVHDCDTPYGECVLGKGHSSKEHGDDHQSADGTWWNVGQTMTASSERETWGKTMDDIADSSEIGRTGDEGRETPLTDILNPRLTVEDAARRAIEAWGIKIGPDGKLTAPDGRVLKVRWLPEQTAATARDLQAFHNLDGEVELGRVTLDAVFTELMEKPKAPAPKVEEFSYAQNGQRHTLTRTPFEQELLKEAKQVLNRRLFTDEDRRRLAARERLNVPTDVTHSNDRYRELLEQSERAKWTPRMEGCTCPDQDGTNLECPFHHHKVVTEDKVIPAVVPPAPGGLSAVTGSVDVAKSLLDRTIAEFAKPPTEKEKRLLRAGVRITNEMHAEYRKAHGKPALDEKGHCTLCREQHNNCACEPKKPPLHNGVCLYCGQTAMKCVCGEDPAGTKYARCTNCELVYKLFLTKSRRCEHCGANPVEVVDPLAESSNRELVERPWDEGEMLVIVNGAQTVVRRYLTYEMVLKAAGFDMERTMSVTYRGKLKAKCDECDGDGRWYDASHAASKRCGNCKGTGEIETNVEGTLTRGKGVRTVLGMVFNVADTSKA